VQAYRTIASHLEHTSADVRAVAGQLVATYPAARTDDAVIPTLIALLSDEQFTSDHQTVADAVQSRVLSWSHPGIVAALEQRLRQVLAAGRTSPATGFLTDRLARSGSLIAVAEIDRFLDASGPRALMMSQYFTALGQCPLTQAEAVLVKHLDRQPPESSLMPHLLSALTARQRLASDTIDRVIALAGHPQPGVRQAVMSVMQRHQPDGDRAHAWKKAVDDARQRFGVDAFPPVNKPASDTPAAQNANDF
jgi:hypothetical protein